MKKFGIMFVGLLVALGVTAATFAGWTDQLVINGSVATGELDLQFTSCSCSDNENIYNVGVPACAIKPGGKEANITVSNSYPGYVATCSLVISNVGTIPAKITALTVNNPNSEISVGLSGVSVGDIIPVPGTKTLTVTNTVNDNAQEETTYTYTITIDAGQFNQ